MPDITPPVVVDLGKRARKRLKQLKDGRGPLADEVRATVEETVQRLGEAADGKTFVPVVVLYRKRVKRRAWPLFNLS